MTSYTSKFTGEEIDELLTKIKNMSESQYIKTFTKDDFTQVGTDQNYFISIPKSEHGLDNPYVSKMLITSSIGEEGTNSFTTNGVCSERILSNGTIKVYITIDLSLYTEYNGKIYLKGE